jgi:hypothetical protein
MIAEFFQAEIFFSGTGAEGSNDCADFLIVKDFIGLSLPDI